MAVRTCDTSVDPVVHAEPTEQAIPSRSSDTATAADAVPRVLASMRRATPLLAADPLGEGVTA